MAKGRTLQKSEFFRSLLGRANTIRNLVARRNNPDRG